MNGSLEMSMRTLISAKRFLTGLILTPYSDFETETRLAAENKECTQRTTMDDSCSISLSQSLLTFSHCSFLIRPCSIRSDTLILSFMDEISSL